MKLPLDSQISKEVCLKAVLFIKKNYLISTLLSVFSVFFSLMPLARLNNVFKE